MKPLRASMLVASLQRAMGVGNKGNARNGEQVCNLLLARKILIVDDNFVNLKVAAGALKKYGADVICAESGEKAIKLLTPPHEFDACFMDIQMPEMDGYVKCYSFCKFFLVTYFVLQHRNFEFVIFLMKMFPYIILCAQVSVYIFFILHLIICMTEKSRL